MLSRKRRREKVLVLVVHSSGGEEGRPLTLHGEIFLSFLIDGKKSSLC
jgi:hypothetical protein